MKPLANSLLAAAALALAPQVVAQATTSVTYDLVNVMLRPDITYPNTTSLYPMTGTFVWTYPVGDFENGSGQFHTYSIPWWNNPSNPPLIETLEVGQIELSMSGNYHGLGLDISLKLLQDLSPFQPAIVDTVNSSFEIEVGINRRGHVISGSIVPRCPAPESYGAGSPGTGGITPAISAFGGFPQIGNAAFAIDGTGLRGGAFTVTGFSLQRDAVPILGITALLDLSQVATSPMMASGALGIPGVGATRLPLPIPNLPGVVGSEFHFQVVALDPGAPGGFASATGGLTIRICH